MISVCVHKVKSVRLCRVILVIILDLLYRQNIFLHTIFEKKVCTFFYCIEDGVSDFTELLVIV
jgi:hypothetical protein